MGEAAAKAWFDGMEAIQTRLHSMEMAQLGSVSNFALAGMVSAFVMGILVLAGTLTLVLAGYPGWLSVLGFLVAAASYVSASVGLENRLRGRGEVVAADLRSTCGRLPSCLWKDVHDRQTASTEPTVQE
ncbi:hypothetical protein OIU34_19995 [Pararhizobium sp. BT-229]|uniref:hypothetical protein n=1 Tax=Pararhizobium sp. BT-229 TaxID=2986923 RepID=UPI0021F6A1C8|nr:hypothetical protein [Pararhizobium sp. BT-229]MCV9964169.1 hypothetical protein [Pararhizobium sp. BT-229]